MFSQLQDRLEGVFKTLRGHGKLSERNVADATREIRMALLEADVDFAVTKLLIDKVKEEALGEKVLKSITPGQQMVKVFNDALVDILGGDPVGLDLTPPARILMVGLNGAGKTTTTGKLALWMKKQGRRPLLVACDLYRPAAVEQLATLAGQIGVPVYKPAPGETDVLKVARDAIAWAATQNGTAILFDTAGRQEIDDALIRELEDLQKFLQCREVLLVADAATGQQAVDVAKRFDEAVGVTGIVLTKMDGDARGGAALSMRHVTGKPIKFAGTGEKPDQFEVFDPSRLAGRILGMGDIVGLVEKAAEAVDTGDMMKMAEKMKTGGLDLNDFLDQLRMMQKLGPLEGLLGMLPGVGSKIKDMKVDEKRIKHVEAIILSMTPKERTKPEILNAKRRLRVAKGSGTSLAAVNNLLRQFGDMRKMMKNKGKMRQMMKQLGGMGGLGGGGGGGLPFGFGR
jgi:signal recognition particle subunit SRP54